MLPSILKRRGDGELQRSSSGPRGVESGANRGECTWREAVWQKCRIRRELKRVRPDPGPRFRLPPLKPRPADRIAVHNLSDSSAFCQERKAKRDWEQKEARGFRFLGSPSLHGLFSCNSVVIQL